jgi:DnaK suppressor protein
MARKDALLRLHQRLTAKRDALRKKLLEEFHASNVSRSGASDVVDAASDGEQSEIDSQLAALESRELAQVERAIALIRQGRYGICESCDHPIPIARLQALPFTPLCVECQRQQEELRGTSDEFDADWETAYEFEGRLSDRELTLGDLDQES